MFLLTGLASLSANYTIFSDAGYTFPKNKLIDKVRSIEYSFFQILTLPLRSVLIAVYESVTNVVVSLHVLIS
jgi:hypothetical protein